jgi:predicted murein hydrolase (TIGR00659 family)
MNPAEAALGIGLTLFVYAGARTLGTRYRLAITNPIVTSVAVIVPALLFFQIDYANYQKGAALVSGLLAPATVALAVPLYKHRAVLRRYAVCACAGMLAGGLVAMVVAVLAAQAVALGHELYSALGIKSATAPIAVQLGPIVGANPGLCAVFAIATGMIGALLGPSILTALAIKDPVARGLAYGTICHGIGTTQALTEGSLEGAVSGVAMGCAAVFVSLAAPRVLPLLM